MATACLTSSERFYCKREHIAAYKNGGKSFVKKLLRQASNWFVILLAINMVPGLAENILCPFTLLKHKTNDRDKNWIQGLTFSISGYCLPGFTKWNLDLFLSHFQICLSHSLFKKLLLIYSWLDSFESACTTFTMLWGSELGAYTERTLSFHPVESSTSSFRLI